MTAERPVLREVSRDPNFPVEKIIVAGNYGPCGGVNMALKTTYRVLSVVDNHEPVYTNWDVVNNGPIMQELRSLGLVNVKNNFELVPDGAIIIFSAHGVPPEFHKIAEQKNLFVVDVTCQLVHRVHSEVKRAVREGKHVVYIAVPGHPEALGVLGEVGEDDITLVAKAADVPDLRLPTEKPSVVYSQTTLLPAEVVEIEEKLREKFPEIEIPNRLDICYAMHNRQAAVDILMGQGINLLLVVGSPHSHNSQELRSKGEKAGIPSYSVDKPEELKGEWFTNETKVVGLTAGASVLDRFTNDVIAWLRAQNPQIEVCRNNQVISEQKLTFRLPEEAINRLSERYS